VEEIRQLVIVIVNFIFFFFFFNFFRGILKILVF